MSIRKLLQGTLTSGAGVIAAAFTLPAGAQDQGAAEGASRGIEEVVVTARRVEERLQDTPLSVSAFRTEDLEKLNIRTVGDAAAFTPNFISNPGPTGGNDGFFFIRGVGQTDLNPATDPGVGTYIDGVYLGRIQGASVDSFDLARIEILRGPQGTLFGRNTIGGAVNITTRDPGKDFGVNLLVGAGSRSLHQVRAAVDVPLGEKAGLLVSGMVRDQDGWGHRPDGVIMDTNKSKAARLKLKWEPTDAFTLTLAGDWSELTGTSQHGVLVGFNGNVFSPFGIPLPPMQQYIHPDQPYLNQSSVDPVKDYDVKGASLTLDWDLGWASLRSITSYRELSQLIAAEYDSTPFTFYEGAFDTDQDQTSQELQLFGKTGRVDWLLGAFYYDESVFHDNIVALGGNNGCNPLPFGPPPFCATPQAYATPYVNRKITNNQAYDLDIEARALFGHAEVSLTDQWSVSLGLRWTEEKKKQAYDFFIDNTANVFNLAGFPPIVLPTLSARNPFLPPTTPTRYEKDWSEVTPSAGIEWHPVEGQLYYLTWARGFKSGGFNGRPNPVDHDNNPATPPTFVPIQAYDPEKIDSYELGAKTQFADNRVRLNVAAFRSDYKGIQLLGLGSSGFFETINAAESRIYGVEAELLARPVEAFELQASLGYTKNDYQQLNPGTILAGIGFDDSLPLTPKFTGSLGAQYTWNLARGDFTLRGDYAYRSELWYEGTNTNLNRQGGFGLANARATYAFDDGRWAVSAYGLNLGDKVYYTNVQDVTAILGVGFAAVSSPREWGVEVRYNFNR